MKLNWSEVADSRAPLQPTFEEPESYACQPLRTSAEALAPS